MALHVQNPFFGYNEPVRKFIFALILLLAILFLIAGFAEVQKIAAILKSGEWVYMGLAVLVELVWLVNVGASYKTIYRIIGIKESRGRLLLLAATAQFVNTVAPAIAGVPAAAVFLADSRRRGHSTGKVMVAWAAYLVFDYIGLLTTVFLGLVILFRRHDLGWAEVIAAIILVLIAAAIFTLLYLGMRSPQKLARVLAWGARRVNRLGRLLRRRELLSVERAASFAHEISEGIRTLSSKPRRLLLPVLLALSNKALLISILALIFLAFKAAFTADLLIAGFSIAYLFDIVSPTPSGIGVVEGVMTLILHSLHVPLEAATVITLAFRGVTFWLPFFIGLLGFRILSESKPELKEQLN